MIAFIRQVQIRFAAFLDQPSPLVKQTSSVVAVVAALVVLAVYPDVNMSHPSIVAVAVVLLVVATALAVIVTRYEKFAPYQMIVPAIDLLAMGFFRAGTGSASSLFAALIILPVIWIASGDGRRFIVYAAVGTSVTLMLPLLLGLSTPQGAADWVRGVFTPIVFAVASARINEVTRQGRAQYRAIRELADEKEQMLQRTVEYAAQLEESESNYRAADGMFRGVWAAVTEQSVIGTDTTGLVDAWNPGATKLLGPTDLDAEDKVYISDFHLHAELEARARELNYPPGETVLNPGFSALVENARLGQAESREWTYVRSDGTHVPVQLSVTKRVDEQGETIGYLFVASDVTQAREVARLKDEFVGLISHELRTPLSSILGYLELMRDDEEQPLSEEQLQYLNVAERNANRLLHLVGDLLFTAQVDSGRFPLDAREVEFAEVVTGSLESARPIADAAGIMLIGKPTGKCPKIFADPVRLGQALDNLISNAIKFTPRGGTVTVTLECTPTHAVMKVHDTGMGIPADEVELLFERFFRATTATRSAVPGVGLGLAITKAIVTAHHGEMAVWSEVGVGTEFSLSLPLAHTEAPARA